MASSSRRDLNKKLFGEIPKTLGKLISLKELDLSGNSLTGTIPQQIGKLSGLKLLNIGSNHLNGPIPPEIGELESLVTLNLLGNNLFGPVPDELGRLTMLEWVFLGVKRLEGPPPNDVGHLDNLSSLGRLAISKNKLFGIPRTLADHLGDHWGIPPAAVVNDGREQIVKYFEDIARSGEVVINTLKVVLVGASEAGKTSLARSLREGAPRLTDDWDRTIGVDVGTPWQVDNEDRLKLVLWDFGGHPDYLPTHRLFYTRWALYLIVVDLYKFEANMVSRREMLDDWLDALLSIIPGTAILLVPTHTDLFDSEEEMNKAVENLRKYVTNVLETRRKDNERAVWERKKAEKDGRLAPTGPHTEQVPVLILCGIKATSCKNPGDLQALLAEIVRISTAKHDEKQEPLFPHLGQPLPKVWERASSVLDGLARGKDLLSSAALGDKSIEERKGKKELAFPARNYVRLTEATEMWTDVVQSLGLQAEVGGEDYTLKAIVALKQQDGTMLQACGIMHLVPSWINKLLRALADHRLADPDLKEWWEMELENFIDCKRNEDPPDLLFKAHGDFRKTGRLSRDYLMFLWREMNEIKNDPDVVDSLIEAAISHRVMLKSPESTVHEREFLVPFRLQPEVESDALVRLQEALRRGRGIKFTWQFFSYPPDIIGLVLTQSLAGKRAHIHACWRRGVIFTMDDLEYVINLYGGVANTTRKATLELSVAASGDSMRLQNPANDVKESLESMFREFYPGVIFSLEEGHITRGEQTWDACYEKLRDSIDVRLGQLDHIDVKIGRLERNLGSVLEQTRASMEKLSSMYDRNFPYPKLVVIRPETEDDRKEYIDAYRNGWCNKKVLREMAYQIKGCYSKPMRLFFICPVDFEEVPCGWDGAGYPFRMDREWCRKIYPAVKASLFVVHVACKIGLGIHLPVSDVLGPLASEIGEEMIDYSVEPPRQEENDLDHGEEVKETPSGDKVYDKITAQAYEALRDFIEKQETVVSGHRYIPHNEKMRLCDDGKGGRVWVSLKNIDKWNARLVDGAHPEVSVPSPSRGEIVSNSSECCCILA